MKYTVEQLQTSINSYKESLAKGTNIAPAHARTMLARREAQLAKLIGGR